MMAEDSNSDFLCLDLDPLTPYHVRDSMNERYWGSPQCSGDPTAGPEQADVMSSRDNSMSESRAATGQCSGYVKSSSPLISEKPVGVKNESPSQVDSVYMLSWKRFRDGKVMRTYYLYLMAKRGFERWIIIDGTVQMKIEV